MEKLDMVKLLEIHPKTLKHVYLNKVAAELHCGVVIVYPTDSGYALGTTLGNKMD